LKGASANIRAEQMRATSELLEKTMRAGDIDNAKIRFDALREYYRAFCEFVAGMRRA
jgi:hypothetical protein